MANGAVGGEFQRRASQTDVQLQNASRISTSYGLIKKSNYPGAAAVRGGALLIAALGIIDTTGTQSSIDTVVMADCTTPAGSDLFLSPEF